MEYDIKVIDELSGTSTAQRAKNFRWLAQQGEKTKIEAVKLQTDLIRQYRREHREQLMSPEFAYAMYALALQKMVWLETAQQRKGDKLTEEEHQKVQQIRIDRIKSKKRKKSSPKKEIIRVRFFELVKKLRAEGLSWRQVSDYIAVHHKTKLTYSYLRDSYIELAEEKAKAGLPSP